jgi:hypothetical protein
MVAKNFEPQEYHQAKAATITGCIEYTTISAPFPQRLTNPRVDS